MKYYTEIVPFELAKKLKEAEFPQDETFSDKWYNKDGTLDILPFRTPICVAPTYADVFDWLIEKRLSAEMERHCGGDWSVALYRFYEPHCWYELIRNAHASTFHEAANAAIEEACEILKEM